MISPGAYKVCLGQATGPARCRYVLWRRKRLAAGHTISLYPVVPLRPARPAQGGARLLRRRFAGRFIDDWLPPDHRQAGRPATLSDEVLQAIRTLVREEISRADPAFGVKR
jgi:hypothetical protein